MDSNTVATINSESEKSRNSHFEILFLQEDASIYLMLELYLLTFNGRLGIKRRMLLHVMMITRSKCLKLYSLRWPAKPSLRNALRELLKQFYLMLARIHSRST